YGAIASILRASGNSKGANIVDKAGIARRNMTNQQAMQNVIYAAVGHGGVGKLQDRARRGELNKRQFEIALGRAICNGMDSSFGLSGRPVYNAFNRALSQGIDFGSSLAKAFGELDNQLRTVLKIAMGNLFRRHDFITVPPEVMQETLGVRPEVTPEYIGVDSRSQLARVMFEADRLGKQLPNMVRLQGKIPGYKTNFAFDRANPRKAGRFKPTATQHLWISIDRLDLAQSKDRYTLELRGAKMRFNIREMKDDRSVPAPPGAYEKLLTSLYDHFAKEFPVLHELRETAKLKAAAAWLKKHKPNLKLPARGRVPWSGPSKIPGLLYFTWTPNPRPGSVVASMMAMGGVSLGIRIPLVPIDGLVVDLRPSRLVAVPEVGPSGAVGLVPKTARDKFPQPVAWVSQGKVKGKDVTAVSFVVGEGEDDGPMVLRRGSDLDAQALLVWKQNDLEGAKTLYRKLADQSGNDPKKKAGYSVVLAGVLAENGEYDAAIRELRKAEKLSPGHPGVFILHAEALVESGKIEEAISELEHYNSLDPGNHAAQKVLGELRQGWKGLKVTPGGAAHALRQRQSADMQGMGLISNNGRTAWEQLASAAAHAKRIKGLLRREGAGAATKASVEAKQVFDTGRGLPVEVAPLALSIRGKKGFIKVPPKVKNTFQWQMLDNQHAALQKRRNNIEKRIKDNKRALEELEKIPGMSAAKKDLTRNVLKETIGNLVKVELPKVENEQKEVQKKAKKMIGFEFDASEKPESEKTPAK
ncbi:MAG: tetratricopeptide repeat protein, partial [Rhodospirillales bacterium]|nr:tetratricopeptide repeat protein [Rhodospirillales bacterium]